MAKWDFPVTRGATDGFSNGAIDTFSGRRLSSLVREIIQNSLDAWDPKAKDPVTVHFSLENIKREQLTDLHSLKRHFESCLEIAEDQEVNKAIDFFKSGLEKLNSDTDVPMLVISDSNTVGLSGPTDREKGPWYALVVSNGLSQKLGDGSLGSYGHGSKAPFSMTNIRSVYYFTKTINNGKEESRFQGKSILQGHRHPDNKKSRTEAVGFYSEAGDPPSPLLNDEIPNWAKRARSNHSDGNGTTLFIPFTEFNEGLFPETKITVIANFYSAIKTGNLRVEVDGELIDLNNVDAHYQWCVENLEHEQDEIDVDYVKAAFKSIDAIINCTSSGVEDLPEFGKIHWHLKLSDDVATKAVSVARHPGMLITRKPHLLKRFASLKPFEMYVYVAKGDGYNALTQLENPAHDNFEFDRVSSTTGGKKVKGKYLRFVEKIKELLKEHAEIHSDEEVLVTELAQLMFDLGGDSDNNKNKDRGNRLLVSSAPIKTPRAPKGTTAAQGQQDGLGGNKGENPGKGGGKNPRGSTSNGLKPSKVGGGRDNVKGGQVKLAAEKLRVVSSASTGGFMKLFFDCHRLGDYEVSLNKVGESESDNDPVILINSDGKKVSKLKFKVENPGRQSFSVNFSNNEEKDFVLEGWLDEVSQ